MNHEIKFFTGSINNLKRDNFDVRILSPNDINASV
jgi:hypothetical protein